MVNCFDHAHLLSAQGTSNYGSGRDFHVTAAQSEKLKSQPATCVMHSAISRTSVTMETPQLKSFSNRAYEQEQQETDEQKPNEQKQADPELGGEPRDEPEAAGGFLHRLQLATSNFLHKNRVIVSRAVKAVALLLYLAYFGYAMYYEIGDEGSIRLVVCTCFGVFLIVLHLVSKVVTISWPPSFWTSDGSLRVRKFVYWGLNLGMAAFMVIYTAVDVGRNNPRNLMSLAGIAFFIVALFVTSTNMSKVRWHPVFWGMAIQYVFALIIIRTSWGFEAFNYLGDRVTELLSYVRAGASFFFGDGLMTVFAFSVLPVIVYMSSLVSILYYLGVMQAIIRVIGRFLAFCLHTSPSESLNTAANIFLGQTESPLIIRPFLADMTKSELHALLTGGFATVAGSTLGAYISFGVKASYLIGASVMSAPAALAMSKLTCPETETSSVDQSKVFQMAAGSSRNMIDAASDGASQSIKLLANLGVNLIAFLSLLAFLDATLVWFGDRIGVDGLTFQLICSYVFYPIAFLMGVDVSDCRRVAQLIGFKTFANEFVAYIKMGVLLQNFVVYKNYTSMYGTNATVEHKSNLDIVLTDWNRTLEGGYLNGRSEVITTYALCGFSNVGSMGIMLGVMGSLAPSRRSELATLVLRALVAGTVTCFMTACIAGLFYEERE